MYTDACSLFLARGLEFSTLQLSNVAQAAPSPLLCLLSVHEARVGDRKFRGFFFFLLGLTGASGLPAGHLLGAKHAAERLQRCCAHPGSFSIKHLRNSFQVYITPSYRMLAQPDNNSVVASRLNSTETGL